MIPAIVIAAAFFLGSIPTGVILARSRGVDLRQVGSGNIGATNVGRALGRPWAIVVLLLDALKGYLPVEIGARLGLAPVPLAAVGLAAVAGHSFSIFLRGRGGKGVATSLGAALALAPEAAFGALSIYVVLVATFRISSIGSIAGVIAFPLLLWLEGSRGPAAYLFGIAAAILVIVRHQDNLRRLRRGEELRA